MTAHAIVRSGSCASDRISSERKRLIKFAEHLERVNIRKCERPLELAGTLPWFREQGLRTVEDVVTKEKTLVYGKHVGWDAVYEFFGLLPILATVTFHPEKIEGLSSKGVAKRIRNLLRKIV